MPLYGYAVIMEKEASFVTVQARGVIAIPPALRRQFGLDRPGAQDGGPAPRLQVCEPPGLAPSASSGWTVPVRKWRSSNVTAR
jgi:hypothetical protein